MHRILEGRNQATIRHFVRDDRIMGRVFHVYILSSASGVLYIGVTNDLERRVFEHKRKTVEGFTQKYDVTRLVYFEAFGDIRDAIAREKEIKGWRREKKIVLIRSVNATFKDLSGNFHG